MTDTIGFVTVFDERPDKMWYKMPGGVAQYNEADDLLYCANREALKEEVIVVGLADEGEILLVTGAESSRIAREKKRYFRKVWKKRLKAVRVAEEPVFLAYVLNETDKSLDAVYYLDLSGQSVHSCYLREAEWFRGGTAYPNLSILDKDGRLIGSYSDRQGAISPHDPVSVRLHPAVQAALDTLNEREQAKHPVPPVCGSDACIFPAPA